MHSMQHAYGNLALKEPDQEFAQAYYADPAPLAGYDFDHANVLLIEDDRSTRRLVAAALDGHCSYHEAPSAGKGISEYVNQIPDIVFLDLELPDGDGHSLLKWIMQNDPAAYVVLFSGNCDAENVRKAMRNGAKGYIPKPFDASLMMYYIHQCPKFHN